jgi:hypothetical protein
MKKRIEHGIEAACFSGGPGEPYYQPEMTCLCGFTTGRVESFEEAGRLIDEHFRIKKDEQKPLKTHDKV